MVDIDKQNTFLAKAVNTHGDRYDYSKVNYVNNKTKVEIICSIHGSFMQRPSDHVNGHRGCPKCGKIAGNKAKLGKSIKTIKQKLEAFKNKAKKVHGDYYSYNYDTFTDALSPMEIICPVHGVFMQKPAYHTAGNGCSECGKVKVANRLVSNTKAFIEKAKVVHNNKYSYGNSDYSGAKEKIIITCPIHGDFLQTPNDHLNGCGCRQCRTESIGWTDSKWEGQGNTSSNFTGYKLYIVKIWDSEESFFKIGKTFTDIAYRFKDISMYYNYKVLNTIEADAKTVCRLERKYHRANSSTKYEPTIAFSGHTECFSKVDIEGVIYE